MTPPPFSFELIVTGLCLITLQGPAGKETGAKFNFLDAPKGQTICGEYFDDSHVPQVIFDLEDLAAGSTTDYESYRTPSGRYIGVYSLKTDLCLTETPKDPFYARHDAGPDPKEPSDPAYEPSVHWIASLTNVDERIDSTVKPDDDKSKFAGTITVDEGTLMSSELGRDQATSKLVDWSLIGDHVPTNPGPDFPKALSGAVTLDLGKVNQQVELVDCATGDSILIFRPKGAGPVHVVAANLPLHSAHYTHIQPMAHFLWYYNLLKWDTTNGACPDDVALPTPPSTLMTGDIGGITGSSVFCPPAMP